jgi:hypothetical protein
MLVDEQQSCELDCAIPSSRMGGAELCGSDTVRCSGQLPEARQSAVIKQSKAEVAVCNLRHCSSYIILHNLW